MRDRGPFENMGWSTVSLTALPSKNCHHFNITDRGIGKELNLDWGKLTKIKVFGGNVFWKVSLQPYRNGK